MFRFAALVTNTAPAIAIKGTARTASKPEITDPPRSSKAVVAAQAAAPVRSKEKDKIIRALRRLK